MKQLVNRDNSEGIVQGTLGSVKTQEIQRVVDAINEYTETRLNKNLIAVKNVDVKEPEIQNNIADGILFSIEKDFDSYSPNIEFPKNKFKNHIFKVLKNDEVKYNKETLDQISLRIDDFFLNESEIIVENDRIISSINREVIKEIEKNAIPNHEKLVGIFKRNLRSLSADDREYLPETAHSLWVILKEYYQHERIKTAVEYILPLFPDELQSNPKFSTDLRDDLWILNETNLALPKSIVERYKLDGEKISISATQTGMPLIFTRLDESLINSQVQSLIIAFVFVTLILIIQLKSLTGGLIAVSPIALTVVLNFALMSYLSIPLDMATILIASIALGIGVDYSIHFTSRFKEEFARSNSQFEALEKTLTTSGRAILINALTVALGFTVLVMGELVPMQRFGWLTAASMIISAFGAITFLPALIIVTKTKFVGDYSRFNASGKMKTLKNKINGFKK